MPTYEYECGSCGQKQEVLQKMTDEALEICPKCGGSLKRLISNGCGFIFKGTGFYITDYKKKTENTPLKEKKNESSEKPAKTESKSSENNKS